MHALRRAEQPAEADLSSAASDAAAIEAGVERVRRVLANLPQDRIARVNALMGLFAFVPTSSEAFTLRKQEEIDEEEAGIQR